MNSYGLVVGIKKVVCFLKAIYFIRDLKFIMNRIFGGKKMTIDMTAIMATF